MGERRGSQGEEPNPPKIADADYLAIVQAGFDHMDEGISMYDDALNLVAWNKAFGKLVEFPDELLQMGRPIADLIGYNIARDTYGEGDAAEILAGRLALLENREHRTFDRPRSDGGIVEIKWFPLPDGGLVITYRDVTQRRRAEERLRQKELKLIALNQALLIERDRAEAANHAKSAFLASMSHELRTPLNAVIGFSQMISDEIYGPVGDPRYREYADDIGGAGTHLLDLINDILDLAKVEAGVEEFQKETVDIAELLGSVLSLVKGRAARMKIHLSHDIQEDLPEFIADRRKLKQILVNLMTNAIKFNKPGGKVSLKIRHSKDNFVIQIVDTGVGLAAEDIPLALSKFGQIDRDKSRSQEGTGLGLPLTRSMVEAHGGSLDLQSRLGKGTTVTIRFPSV